MSTAAERENLDGRLPQAQPRFEGDGSSVNRNRFHVEAVGQGDPVMYSGQAGPAKFTAGDRE